MEPGPSIFDENLLAVAVGLSKVSIFHLLDMHLKKWRKTVKKSLSTKKSLFFLLNVLFLSRKYRLLHNAVGMQKLKRRLPNFVPFRLPSASFCHCSLEIFVFSLTSHILSYWVFRFAVFSSGFLPKRCACLSARRSLVMGNVLSWTCLCFHYSLLCWTEWSSDQAVGILAVFFFTKKKKI